MYMAYAVVTDISAGSLPTDVIWKLVGGIVLLISVIVPDVNIMETIKRKAFGTYD